MSVHLDLSKLDGNIARYTARVLDAGVALRVHIKGHRVPEITARQLRAGAVGVSVHSAAEAKAHVRPGVGNIVVAWPWRDPWRWPLFAGLARSRSCDVSVHVGDPAVVPALAAAARSAGIRLGVRVEVDTGAPHDAVPLARIVDAESSLRFEGVTGYAAIATADEADRRFEVGRGHAQLLVGVADELKQAGLPCSVVSAGGTPTLAGALSVPGVTEVCCGAYALLDSGLAALGECKLDDVAVSLNDADARADADLLTGADQVWEPGVTMARIGESTVLPAHICPLVAKRPLLRVLRDGAQVAVWRPLVEPDRPLTA